jgi:hypothetical protein
MTIKNTVLTALKTVLTNTHAVELPPEPTWPAIVFEVESVSEKQWVQGGGYDQHHIVVTILAKTLTQVETLRVGVNAAMGGIAGYLIDGDSGDAAYEGDASLYGHYSNHTIRTPRF